MTEDQERQDLEEGYDSSQLQYDPRRKYERIMLAAAEATRLNEEIRRKGTKLANKVTIEALKRVDEGKVKSVMRDPSKPASEPEVIVDPIPEIPSSTLFAPPPEPETDTDSEAETDASTKTEE